MWRFLPALPPGVLFLHSSRFCRQLNHVCCSAVILICLCIMFLLSGCDSPRGQPYALPTLQLPHVKLVPGFEAFYQRNVHGDELEHLNNFAA
jgi:hypothetical protein